MEAYHDVAIKTQCIKHILEFYIDNGKGVATALNKALLLSNWSKSNSDVNVLYQGTAVRVRSDQISSSIHKETESLKEQNEHRSCACNAVH